MSSGTLLVVATPIGNLEDITLRALRTLSEVATIAAEDTRVTRKLLAHHGIGTRLVSFREQNATRAIPELLDLLADGRDVALVSDAGTPAISDPGQQLVQAAVQRGIRVCPIPGPSALAAALSVAALPGDGVRFAGFLPRAGRRRRERVASMAVDPTCTVLYEAPSRIGRTLTELIAACGAERQAVVLRELTKVHEEIARGTLGELAHRFANRVKGEITLVMAGADIVADEELGDDHLRQIVQQQIDSGRSAKDIAATLSRTLGVKRNRIYEMAVEGICDHRN